MEIRDGMDPEIVQIKKMVRCLTLEEIAEDFIIFGELVEKHHPKGMNLIEDFKKANSDKDNPIYKVKLPTAVVEFHKILHTKYSDRKMVTAIFMRVLEELTSRSSPRIEK